MSSISTGYMSCFFNFWKLSSLMTWLNPAGICLCGFRIHAGGNQTLGKETVLFVNLFRHFPANVGQVQEIVAVHRQKTSIPQGRHRMAHAGL